MKNLVVLSGAGISAESGIKTFRDEDGLWEGYNVMDVASPVGFRKNPELVLNFYNERRRQLLQTGPNAAHFILAELEKHFNIDIVTQNVDDLHERAGSSRVLHLHGELLKARSTRRNDLVYAWQKDILIGDLCELGSQLRPHIVWFGEGVPLIYQASLLVQSADILLVIGTSLQVYPAAGLLDYASSGAKLYYIDPKPQVHAQFVNAKNAVIIPEKATTGMEKIYPELVTLGIS